MEIKLIAETSDFIIDALDEIRSRAMDDEVVLFVSLWQRRKYLRSMQNFFVVANLLNDPVEGLEV